MTRKRILIAGAGLAGLSAAWHLQKNGVDCEVFEKEAEVGGLCRSKHRLGFIFDYCGHLLHFKHPQTLDFIKGLCGAGALQRHERSAWIYSHGTYTKYPFQANLFGLPSSVIKECLLGLVETLERGHQAKNGQADFFEWIHQHFGKGIAAHFMVPYNKKFWTVPVQKLTCEWLDGIIPLPSLRQTIEGTIEENNGQFGYNAQFWYPKAGGIHRLPLALARTIKNVHTSCAVKKIDIRRKQITLGSGVKARFDSLISTIPLPELPGIVEPLPAQILRQFGRLQWNSIFNLNVGIERKGRLAKHWVYFPQEDLSFFRVGFFHNFSRAQAPGDKSSLYVETSYSKHRPIDKGAIVGRMLEDLKKIGLLSGEDTICALDTNDIQYGYPLYDKAYNASRKEIIAYLLKNDIIPCGRYGSWRYMSMEDAMLDAGHVFKKVTG